MKPDRIVITWVSSGPGGAEQSTKILGDTICGYFNIDIDVIIWYSGTPPTNENSVVGRVKQFACRSYQEYTVRLTQSLDNPGVVTFLFSNQRSFGVDLAIARSHRVKTAIIFRGMADPQITIQTIPPGQEELKPVILSAFDWELFSQADAIVAISDSAAAALRNMTPAPEKVTRIYNSLSNDWVSEISPAIPARPQAANFLIVSRLVQWKALTLALTAFAELASEFPDTCLHVLGDGPQKDELENFVTSKKLSQRIYIEGWVSDPRPWYSQADCLIHPAPLEGFGRVLAEANACGLVAITANSGAGGELVVDGETGFTFEPQDAHSLYLTLKKFVELDANARQRMSQNARGKAGELFNARTIAGQYFSLAQKILESPSFRLP